MPICKNCNKRINRFNKDRCPICGVEFPFEGMSSDTVEITTNIDVDNINIDFHPRKKSKLLLFFCLIGLTGVPFFYLKKKALGFIQLFSSILVYVALCLTLYFAANMESWLCGLVSLGAIYLINIVIGLIFYFTPNLKDGNGEFVV